ncbi:hypothetical protein DFH09DRAFT_1372388 [Mycena vulgaris]|nr:hypothetical protein DFH09DRAFT_1372388 [Mycena vulgaris]
MSEHESERKGDEGEITEAKTDALSARKNTAALVRTPVRGRFRFRARTMPSQRYTRAKATKECSRCPLLVTRYSYRDLLTANSKQGVRGGRWVRQGSLHYRRWHLRHRDAGCLSPAQNPARAFLPLSVEHTPSCFLLPLRAHLVAGGPFWYAACTRV